MDRAQKVDARRFYQEDMGVQSPELLDKLVEVSRVLTLQKGEILNKKGERQTMVAFLVDGIIRGIGEDSEGKEQTIGFVAHHGDVALSNMDLAGCHISTDQALVPTTIIQLPIDYVIRAMKEETEVTRIYREQIVKWGMIYQSRALSLSQGDATERFEWFCREYPGMVDVINNRYIASFLGITPVTLSRLRHGVATKAGREKKKDEE